MNANILFLFYDPLTAFFFPGLSLESHGLECRCPCVNMLDHHHFTCWFFIILRFCPAFCPVCTNSHHSLLSHTLCKYLTVTAIINVDTLPMMWLEMDTSQSYPVKWHPTSWVLRDRKPEQAAGELGLSWTKMCT